MSLSVSGESIFKSQENDEPQPHDRAPVRETVTINRNRPLCLYFQRGLCDFGDECDFAHVESAEARVPICRYFLKGNCRFGEECIYIHSAPEDSRPNRSNRSDRSTRPSGPSNQEHVPETSTDAEDQGKTSWRKNSKKKDKVQICPACGAFYVEHCAFCEGDQEQV